MVWTTGSDILSEMNNKELNEQLAALGISPIKDKGPCPSRTAYIEARDTKIDSSLDIDDYKAAKKSLAAKIKSLKSIYLTNFYQWFAHTNPHLLYEIGEDKNYWVYSEETGIYDEINFTTVRGLIINQMIVDGLEDVATEAQVKHTLARFRAMFVDRSVAYDGFDNDPDMFHARNGWVNVKTLEFTPHTPNRYSRRVSAVDYDAKATCSTYDKFLDQDMELQADQVRVIDQFSGLLLTPEITRQKMLVLIGKPGCGKSTLMECWSDILGDLATQKGLGQINSESFARFGGSTLIGRRLCWFDEVQVTRAEMSSSLINLVSGHHIEVERKGINGLVQADNHLKCVLTANTLPRSAEIGIYRRMILMYLEHSFTDDMSANPNMRNVLMSEGSGILNRMLKGLADLNRNNGFTMIEGHDDLIEEYKASSNTVAEFLEEYFVFDETATPLDIKVVLQSYKDFSKDRYSEALTPQRFGMMIKSHGLREFDRIYSKKDWKGYKKIHGLKLREGYVINAQGWIKEATSEQF